MNRPSPPKPPPMRALLNYTWVNEYELVDWYTDAGKLYDKHRPSSNWFTDLFKKDWQKKLDVSLSRNRMLCTEWPR